MEKANIIKSIEAKYLSKYTVEEKNATKPWGAYWVIDRVQSVHFIKTFFTERVYMELESVLKSQAIPNLSPKILLVAPESRLSWQYHHRRSEYWQVLEGPVGVARSIDDEQPTPKTYQVGELIQLAVEERHRLIGLQTWGVIAEIWVHTKADNLSDEEDIVRVQDDYGR